MIIIGENALINGLNWNIKDNLLIYSMVPIVFSLTVLTVILFIAFMFRTPSKKEIKKFVDKTNEKDIWSKLGFWPCEKKN